MVPKLFPLNCLAIVKFVTSRSSDPGVNNGASTSGDVIMLDESVNVGAGGSGGGSSIGVGGAGGSKADDDVGTDGVTSEGEKVPSEGIQV